MSGENKVVELKENKLEKISGGSSISDSNEITIEAGYYYSRYSKDYIYFLGTTKTGYKDFKVVVKQYEKRDDSFVYISDFYIALEELQKCEKVQTGLLSLQFIG